MWRVRQVGLLVVLGLLMTAGFPGQAVSEDEGWADPNDAQIRPGVQVSTPTGTCTSNFIFTAGTDVLLGTAAHCFTTSGSTQTNGCLAGTHPIGSSVTIQGASNPGELAYSGWVTMQAEDEPSNTPQCQYNDFALIKLHPDDHDRVSPAMRFFGGPETLATSASTGNKVLTFGASPLRPGIGMGDLVHTGAKEGYVLSGSGNGWSHRVYTLTPGIPGDSGSGVLTGDGAALGIVVTVQLFPYAASNGVTNLSRALEYAEDKTGVVYELATWELTNGGLMP